MVSDETYEFIVDYLYERISPSVGGSYGEDDVSPKKDKEANLCDLFESYVYMDGQGYFLLSDTGVLYVYNGRWYERVTTETFLSEVVKGVLTRIGINKVYSKFSNKFIAKECLSGMENRRQGRFVPDRRYIVFSNGVFDVKEGVLLPFGRDKRTDIVLDIAYDGSAESRLWNDKLTEIIPNAQMREAFQMFCGSLLVNRDEIRIEYVCFLIGPGSNGKSVVANAIQSTFGEQYFTTFDPEQLLNDANRMFNLSNLDGALANFTDDLQQGNISSSGFKSFASGQYFQARHPYGRKIFKVKAPPLLCCTNSLPPTTDDSWGYHRRILPIYSTNRIWGEHDRDPMLKHKLESDDVRMAIFNWIYEGYRMIIKNGGNIRLGDDVVAAQEGARADSNSVRRWLRDRGLVRIEVRPDGHVCWRPLRDWYDDYRRTCIENGDKPQTSRSVCKIFREQCFIEARRRDGIWFCIGTLGVDKDYDGTEIGDGAPTREDVAPF